MANHKQIQRNKGEECFFVDLVGVVANKESIVKKNERSKYRDFYWLIRGYFLLAVLSLSKGESFLLLLR